MAQLDLTTYFSQIFWLFVFFLSFYIVSVNYLLPAITRGIKLREKKIDVSGSIALNIEETSLNTSLDLIISDYFSQSRQYLLSIPSEKTLSKAIEFVIETGTKNCQFNVKKQSEELNQLFNLYYTK